MRRFRGIALMLVALALCVPAAQAQEAGQRVFEIYAGYYIPGIDDLDNDLTYGLRFGGRPTEAWGWSLQAGTLDLNQNNTRPLAGTVRDAQGYFVDLDGIWYVAGSNFGLFGGVGFGTVDIELQDTNEDISDDAFTYNFGVHYLWNFGTNSLVKPEIRLRKWEGDTYEKTDEEYSISYGWRF